MIRTTSALAATVLMLASLVACQSWSARAQNAQPVDAEAVFSGQVCGIESEHAEVHWIQTPQEWRRWQGEASRTAIGMGDGADVQQPPVDFNRFSVVLVGLGQKPTGGYAVGLGAAGVQLSDQQLDLYLDISEPPRDAMVIQMITSPCVAVKLPKLNVSRVRALDHKGQVIAQKQVSP
jgi:hypothetical protein